MRGKPLLASLPLIGQVLVLVGIAMILAVVLSFVGVGYAYIVLGEDVVTNNDLLKDYSNPQVLHVMKIIQMCSSIGMFVLPAFLFAWLVSREPGKYMFMQQRPALGHLLTAFFLVFSALPIINFVYEWNMSLDLPDGWLETFMRGAESQAEILTKAFLTMDTYGDLAFNLFLIAFLPALGEELIFRGVGQRLIIKLFGNVHAGIWITAIIFSAIHFQFYGFLPRMLLGALLGYLLAWSGSLWVPILAHFVNNGAAVIAQWLAQRQVAPENFEDIGANEGEFAWVMASVAITGLLLWTLYRTKEGRYDELAQPEEPHNPFYNDPAGR